MNTHTPGLELSAAAALLLVGMLLVMWTQQTSSSRCVLAPDAPRHLVWNRDTDREHLMNDIASADRIAKRYAASTPSAADPDTRFLECQATLIQQVANVHGMPLDRLRGSAH
jgi:hypothetical protein